MTENKEGIKIPYLIAIALLIMIAVVTFSVTSLIDRRQAESGGNYNYPAPQGQTQASAPSANGATQNAKLALVNFKYTLTPNKIKKGVPVRIEVDAGTLSGCMTTVVFKDFGITKRITSSDNIIEFTPDKTGTFWITCGMGMGPGSYEVVNADGTSSPSAAAAQAPPSGGSCGAGGGGCGCGMR